MTPHQAQMTPYQVIVMILKYLKKKSFEAGTRVVIPINWNSNINRTIKRAMKERWGITPTIEGTGNIQTLSFMVVPTMKKDFAETADTMF